MNLVTVTRRAFLAAVKDDFLPRAVMLDKTISILPVQIFLHGSFNALDAVMIEISEADDVTKH